MPEALPSPDRPLRIGTRGSPLALAQARETRGRLMAAHGLPQDAFEILPIRTIGDRVLDRPLSDLGGKGLFTREIEIALLEGAVDIAVHSMKDMPTLQPEGLGVTCLLPREDVRDAFVSLTGGTLASLARGAVVGTSSLRRQAQLKARRPDLRIVPFRGNVQTRLAKLEAGVAQATLLAMAGLRRLGLAGGMAARPGPVDPVPADPVPVEDLLPAIAQGCIGVEQRRGDDFVSGLLAPIHHGPTGVRLAAERAFLLGLDGSCQTPIAGLAELDGDRIRLRGEILRPDGSERLTFDETARAADAPALGAAAAEDLRGRAGPGFFAA